MMKQLQSRCHSTVYKNELRITAYYVIIALILMGHSLRASDCPPDSLSLSEKIDFISQHTQTTEESCLLAIVSNIDGNRRSSLDTLTSILDRWTTHHRLSSRLLCAGYNNQVVHGHTQLWNTLWRSYQASHKQLFTEVYRLYNDGSMYTADTLLYIYDSEGKIDNQELSLWIKIKTITKAYNALPHLYCRLFTLAQKPQKSLSMPEPLPGSMYVIKTQFQQTLDESGKDNIPQILSGFKNCVLSTKNLNDAELLRWLAYLLGNYGLYDDELEVTLAIRSSDDGFSVSSELADLTRNRFINKSFVHALRAGREAFKKAENNDERSTAGSLVYQSFIALGLNDSALQWIHYAQLTNLNNLLNAINLYQLSGQITQAQTLINQFPSSLVKDTLTIRQAVFSQNLKTAHELIHRNDSLKKYKNELYLWKVRVALFNKESDNLMKLLDSIPEIPTFSGAAEVLGYKYRILKLMDYPEALEAWQLIEYNCYIERLVAALTLLEQLHCDAGCKAECALVVSHHLYERKKIAEALAVLSSFDESGVSAEFLYQKALCLHKQGKPVECRKLLEKILLDFPDDIYSGKARLILSDLPSG
jgi:hypothetical protein